MHLFSQIGHRVRLLECIHYSFLRWTCKSKDSELKAIFVVKRIFWQFHQKIDGVCQVNCSKKNLIRGVCQRKCTKDICVYFYSTREFPIYFVCPGCELSCFVYISVTVFILIYGSSKKPRGTKIQYTLTFKNILTDRISKNIFDGVLHPQFPSCLTLFSCLFIWSWK